MTFSHQLRGLFLLAVFAFIMGQAPVASASEIREIPVGYFYVNMPAIGDVNGDGQPEIVVTASGVDLRSFTIAGSSVITVVNNQGEIVSGWPVVFSTEAALLPPTPAAVADLDGDGQAEIIFGYGHTLYVLNGSGQLIWKQYVEGFFKKKPETVDLDNDGLQEIILGADQFLGNARVHIWHADGTPFVGTPILLDEYYASSPSVYIDRDCILLAVGGGNGYTNPSGSLYLFACQQDQIERRWQMNIGQHPISKPVFADLHHDGVIDLIGGTYSASVYAVDSRDGRFLPGWPQPVSSSVFTSPAVYQRDHETFVLAVDLSGQLRAWDSRGTLLWMRQIDPNAIDQITLADVQGDNEIPDIVLGVNRGVVVLNVLDGSVKKDWPLGDYWVTGTLTVQLQNARSPSVVLAGVSNITEEAKLFIVNPEN